MAPGDWRFPAILVTSMVIAMILTFFQHRAYNRQLNVALAASKRKSEMLVSGRGRSFRGGAIVVLLVDTATREITWASAMSGLTVFARFKEVPALLGPVDTATERLSKPAKQLVKAVEMALEQVAIAEKRSTNNSAMVRKSSTTTSSARGGSLIRRRTPGNVERK